MMPTQETAGNRPRGDLVKPVVVALAVKLVALTVLYFAFFTPSAAPDPAQAGSAILGLPTGR